MRAGGLGGGAAGQVQGQDAPHRRRHALPLRPQLRLARTHLLGGATEMKNLASDFKEEQCLFRVTGQNGKNLGISMFRHTPWVVGKELEILVGR